MFKNDKKSLSKNAKTFIILYCKFSFAKTNYYLGFQSKLNQSIFNLLVAVTTRNNNFNNIVT